MGGPFHRRDALAAGLSVKQLRSRCWLRLFPNVYVHRSLEVTHDLRLAAVQLAAPPGAVLRGLTAAWVYGVWQPRPGAEVPIELAVERGCGGGRDARMGSRRRVLDPIDVNEIRGIPVTSPERTWFELCARSSLVGSVVFADAFGHADLVTKRGLMRFADERPHWPHVRKARVAVDLSRFEAASPMETRLRMVIVLAGLPEPMGINVGIYDEAGNLLGIVDLLYLDPVFGIEFDGSYHQSAEQRAKDNVRENRLLIGDVPLLRYVADDVYRHPERIVREVAAMLGGRPQPKRWAA